MKILLKHLVKGESYFLSCEVTPEVLQSISNLNCPADLPPHTPIQEWHIQHLMGLLQRKHLTHSYLGEIQKSTIVSAWLSCSVASVELLFSLDQPASVQQWLWNMSLYPMRCCSSHGQASVPQPCFPHPGTTAESAQPWGINKLNSGNKLSLAAGQWGWNAQSSSCSLLLLLPGGVALVLVLHPIPCLQPQLVWCVPWQAVVKFISSNLRHKQCGYLCLSHASRGDGGKRALGGHSWAHPKKDHLKWVMPLSLLSCKKTLQSALS